MQQTAGVNNDVENPSTTSDTTNGTDNENRLNEGSERMRSVEAGKKGNKCLEMKVKPKWFSNIKHPWVNSIKDQQDNGIGGNKGPKHISKKSNVWFNCMKGKQSEDDRDSCNDNNVATPLMMRHAKTDNEIGNHQSEEETSLQNLQNLQVKYLPRRNKSGSVYTMDEINGLLGEVPEEGLSSENDDDIVCRKLTMEAFVRLFP